MLRRRGPRSEKEVVIRFADDGPDARVWVASPGFFSRLLKKGFTPSVVNGEHSATFIVPKKLVGIRRPRRPKGSD